MRTVLSCMLAVCLLAGLAFAAAGPNARPVPLNPFIPAETDSGGPDAYGYKYKTSTDPGGPPATFIDLSTIGTLVTGLADDNYVGSFPLGFTFHFYWYDVDQMWIGSNGYLEFSNPYIAAQPFPDTIPSPELPNDFVAPYMADWNPEVGGSVYRWTNGLDSTIVEWKQIPAWNLGGDHTFEVVLTSTDSSITFVYGAQHGTVFYNDILVGIESVSGQVGLKYSNFSPYIPSNFAMKFYYPEVVTYQAHDLAAYQCANSTSQGFFQIATENYTPTAIVKNVGNQNETGYTARFVIMKDSTTGNIVYDHTISGGAIAAGEQQTLTFPVWMPSTVGQYSMKLTVTLASDVNPFNDTRITECQALVLPGAVKYDDGSSSQSGWSWQGGNGGVANYFVPPSYPATIDSVRFYVLSFYSGNPHPFTAKILDDDGPNGAPGTVLFTATIATPLANTWYGAAAYVTVNSGGFYVAWFMQDSLTRPLGLDNTVTQPKSRQGWEFTGAWAPFRDRESSDFMIRARISTIPAIPLDVNLTPISPPITIPAAGGNFQFTATVQRVSGAQSPFYVWSRDRFPDGTYTANLLGPVLINPPVGQLVTRLRTQNVPGTWPAGVHYYIGYANPTIAYPAVDSSSFTWTKLTTGAEGPWITDAICSGEPFPGEEIPLLSRGDRGDLVAVSPNPFNPVTALSYKLQAASQVSIRVYDTAGRLMATLVEETQEAGTHSVTFDGSKLASGLYFVRLQAGEVTQVRKMVLMK